MKRKTKSALSRRSSASGKVDHQAEHARAIESFRAGNIEAALRHVNTAIRAQPDMAIYQADAGVILMALGRNEAAVIPLQRATQLDPNHADAHYNLGEAYQALGQKEKSIEAFKVAISLNRGLAWKKIQIAVRRWFRIGK